MAFPEAHWGSDSGLPILTNFDAVFQLEGDSRAGKTYRIIPVIRRKTGQHYTVKVPLKKEYIHGLAKEFTFLDRLRDQPGIIRSHSFGLVKWLEGTPRDSALALRRCIEGPVGFLDRLAGRVLSLDEIKTTSQRRQTLLWLIHLIIALKRHHILLVDFHLANCFILASGQLCLYDLSKAISSDPECPFYQAAADETSTLSALLELVYSDTESDPIMAEIGEKLNLMYEAKLTQPDLVLSYERLLEDSRRDDWSDNSDDSA